MSSVTFPTNLGGNGQTYTDDNNPSTGLRDGGWRSRFVPCLEQTVAIANTLTNRVIFGSDVSSTSIAVSTGSKTLTTSGSFTWAAGMFVTIARTSATTNYLFGQVVSYNASTDQLVVNVTSVAGSGTYTDWTIAIAPPGLAPSTFTGPATITVGSGSDALRITQTGSGNALLVEDAANPDSSPFVVNTDGRVRRGTLSNTFSFQTAVGNTYNTPGIVNTGVSANDGALINAVFNPTGTAFGSALCLARSGGATVGDYTVIPNNLAIGQISFNGSDGVKFIEAAVIYGQVDGTPSVDDMPGRLVFSTTRDGASIPTEAFRINSSQNVLFGRTYAGSERIGVGGGTSSLTTTTSALGILNDTIVSSAQTTAYTANSTYISTQAASFTLGNMTHYRANQFTIGAGSAVTNQMGFFADGSLTGAGANHGFYSAIPSGSGRYNFYAAGTADNYFAGSVGIGANPNATIHHLRLGGSFKSSQYPVLCLADASVPSTAASGGVYVFRSQPRTDAASFSIGALQHFTAEQGTFGAGSCVTNQVGFVASSSLTGATNNFGFYSNIAAPTSGGSTASNVASVSSTGTTVTVNTSAAHGLSNNQTVTISLTANATALVSGVTCTILAVGTTDFTLIGASSNTVGVSFTATGVGVGSGTVTLNQQNSGKTITVVNTTQFTYTASSSATFTSITASGTVTPTTRYNFYAAGTADNFFEGNIKTDGTLAGGYSALSAGTTAMGLASDKVVKVTPNATATFTTTVAPAGATASIIIVTSGTTSYTITFGTGFLTTGTLATGTVTAKTFVVNFVSDGTTMIETSRTVAM